MLRISNIKAPLSLPLSELPDFLAEILKTSKPFSSFRLIKKAVDARSRSQTFFVYTVDVETPEEETILKYKHWPFIDKVNPQQALQIPHCRKEEKRPFIIGSGPAGMFAGLALAKAGLRPLIFERGQPVPIRQKDVENFWQSGTLNPDSNVQFGEGGAGTFSDGKLMSGIKKDVYTAEVFAELVAAGAPEDILYLAKPHLGTDKLALIVQKIREKIVSLGGEYLFGHRLEDLVVKDKKLQAALIRKPNGEIMEFPASELLLAVGHSARDTFEMLYKRQIPLVPKAFSIGARIEHPQSLINKAIYHENVAHPALGATDYKLSVHLPNGRSLYTFCMCPGGVVVSAASEPERVVTNGMSYYARDKKNANAALLVGVTPQDFGGDHPLQGMYWQRELEHKAYLAGEKTYKAPAQLVKDVLQNRVSVKAAGVQPSYSRGVVWGDLGKVLPDYVMETFRLGILEMDKKLHGFAMPEAVLTGVETRSSSPIKILRDEQFESPVKGIFPCGEGAGYAGGIVSAAVDGLKTALSIIDRRFQN